MRASLTLIRRIAEELRGEGTFAGFTQDTMTHAEVNRLLAGAPSSE